MRRSLELHGANGMEHLHRSFERPFVPRRSQREERRLSERCKVDSPLVTRQDEGIRPYVRHNEQEHEQGQEEQAAGNNFHDVRPTT